MSKALVIAVLLTTLTSNSPTDLMSLSEWLDMPSKDRDESYILVRCAGLYDGLDTYINDDDFGPGSLADFRDAAILLSNFAVRLRADSSEMRLAEVATIVEEDIERISILYQVRMKRSFDQRGQAIVGDDLTQGDIEVCSGVLDALLSGKLWHWS